MAPLTNVSPEVAYCVLAAHALYQDSTVTREEQEALRDALAASRLFGGKRPAEPTIREASALEAKTGQAELIETALDSVPADYRDDAYAVVARLSHADDHGDRQEQEFLSHVRQKFQLP